MIAQLSLVILATLAEGINQEEPRGRIIARQIICSILFLGF